MTNRLIAQIPEPLGDPDSMLAAVRAIRSAVQTLALNAAGQSDSQIFALSGTTGKMAAIAASIDAGADATASFTLLAPSGIIVAFSYTGYAASAAGNLILAVDGADLATVALNIDGAGKALPMTAYTLIGNLGPGPHSVAVRTSTGLNGFSVAVLGSTR